VSLSAARRLALTRQRLAGKRPARGRPGILEVIKDLGYVQLDPTNVVARSHLLVLWSRLGIFDVAALENLLWHERRLFEHAAMIYPMEDLPFRREAMRRYRLAETPWARRAVSWLETNAGLRRHVLARLRRGPPLPTSAFADLADASWRSTGWTSGRNVSQALEFLSRQGHVAVAGRAGGQRLWTLATRWLPRAGRLSARALAEGAVERALRSMGIATLSQLRRHYAFARFIEPETVASLVRAGRIVQVALDAAAGSWLVRAEDLPALERARREDWGARTTLLSPFDNLIIDRPRTEALFGFRYRMEIYVPRDLREHGYWAMPILHGERLIGRVDPALDRREKSLVINAMSVESDAPRGGAVGRAIRSAIEDLATFVGAAQVVWHCRPPAMWRAGLRA
jgi:uncharacterized protein YcaQ